MLDRSRCFVPAAFTIMFIAGLPAASDDFQRNLATFPNENGVAQTFVSSGRLEVSGAFFQSLGTNGRSCASCHQPGDNWSVTPRGIQQRFNMTQGTDPIFRPNDGANCDTADTSTVAARRAAYSQLLSKGLFRVTVSVPDNAEFTVLSAVNPYGCVSTSTLSLYRRPLPATNLRFLTTVMWDGRESFAGNTLEQNLRHQSNDATTGHAQGHDLTSAQMDEIVAFEMSLTTAQAVNAAGNLDRQGGRGGAVALFTQPFFVGINDPLGPGVFNSSAFDIFAWTQDNAESRRSVARGEAIFDTRPIQIRDVKGLNDLLGADVIPGTCTTCHNTPNIGNHSVPLAIDIGLNDVARYTADMPLYLLQNKTTGATIQTMDPARALITGKWNDIGKTKGPVLRGLSGRAPYFHNGSAASLGDVVDFYDTRFGMGLTRQDKQDLVNFLSSL